MVEGPQQRGVVVADQHLTPRPRVDPGASGGRRVSRIGRSWARTRRSSGVRRARCRRRGRALRSRIRPAGRREAGPPWCTRHPGCPRGRGPRRSPPRSPGPRPGPDPTPTRCPESPRRWNGSEDPIAIGSRDAPALVDDPDVHPAGHRARPRRAARLRRRGPARCRPGWPRPVPAAPGRYATGGGSSGCRRDLARPAARGWPTAASTTSSTSVL